MYKSIDLCRTYRTMSMVDDKPFVLVRRKGKKAPTWEGVISMPKNPEISPWHLVCRYVEMTAQCPAASALLRSVKHPFAPLSANTIGSITKKLMKALELPDHWRPHSTRGAGVMLYKKLGLSSEQVCEIGQWKNVTAFTQHYLRLGATQVAASSLQGIVHNASPGTCAESDLSSTPGKILNPGGRDREDGAQGTGEPARAKPPPLPVEVGCQQHRKRKALKQLQKVGRKRQCVLQAERQDASGLHQGDRFQFAAALVPASRRQPTASSTKRWRRTGETT